jgi:ATP-dependent helicase/nuclease subunit A
VSSPEPPCLQTGDRLTPSQRQAVTARGNVLVMAGAGTGKTHTLIERCLHCLCSEQPPASLEEILVVSFTEAAAAEMRRRLRERLEEKLRAAPDESHWTEQIALFDTAHIGTLHSFCLRLVREHFHELGLDPQLAVLDEGEARLLADEMLEEEMQDHYAGQDELAGAVRQLIQIYGGGRDRSVRQLVLRLHRYAQTRPDTAGWLARQLEQFAAPAPDEWRTWLLAAIRDWHDEWLPELEKPGTPANEKAAELAGMLQQWPEDFSRKTAAELLKQIVSADGNWPAGRKTVLRRPLEGFFDEARFLVSLAAVENGRDPLVEDWDWVRSHLGALVRLTQNFSARFAARKREDGVLDFHDLEQFALKLLWDFAADKPTPVAGRWRQKIRFVFVDEYQDINAAQDKIIQALSRDGTEANRFLVGDVKQSIYRFRLADPKIFRDYAAAWRGKSGQTIPLAENFRSREGLLDLVNSIFEPLLCEAIGGVGYPAEARLQFGAPGSRAELRAAKDSSPRAELLLRFKQGRRGAEAGDESGADDPADLLETEKEARLLGRRLKQLVDEKQAIWDPEKKGFRPAEWRDMAVLLRAPADKAEMFAKEFQRAGVPLVVERGGFYDSGEIMDLLGLLQLLDNPLQDVPAIAVLRSPLAGLSVDELARIRLVAGGHFWTALNRWREVTRDGGVAGSEAAAETFPKVDKFLKDFSRWRQLARQVSLSQCLESVLAETLYADWLLAQPRGAQRRANVERFLGLAQKFDQFQRQGLFRFLKFIEAQRAAGVEPDVAAVADENAVRLMSIHQSKGLEFPIVAVADLAKPFNTQDLRGEIIFDETFGLCPQIKPPHTGRRYPSLPHWLAQRHQRREQWGEELRLLYVALTRARDTLILAAAVSERKWESLWQQPGPITTRAIVAASSYADWLGLWFAQNTKGAMEGATAGVRPHLRWRLAADAELADGSAVEAAEKQLPPLNDQILRQLRETLMWEYNFDAATRRVAKSSVTALRRQAADEADDEAEQVFRLPFSAKRPAPSARTPNLSAADAGRAHHQFLQFFALEKAGDLETLTAESERLARENILSAAGRAALDLEGIAAFWDSEAGRRIRAQAANVRRELAFTARFSPAELEAVTGVKSAPGLEDEFVVVQGVADLVVLLPGEIWLLDFKTDEIRRSGLADKIKAYTPQLNLYARALEKIYSRPVTARWLHFLAANRTETI